jgi:hypothetical protein
MLLLGLALTLVLYWVPQLALLAYPFLLLSTLAHEMGHGLAAIAVGAGFERLEMWSDGSGVATWSGDLGRLRLALVAAGGLVGPAVAASVAFRLGRKVRGARAGLVVLTAFLLVALVLVVRGGFGFVFVGCVVAVCGLIAWKGSDEVAQLWLVFLALQLALSVFSRGEYLFTAVAETGAGTMPSDTGVMASALLLPYWFWGALCGTFSATVVALAVKAYWRR